jgi:hypothetical protein
LFTCRFPGAKQLLFFTKIRVFLSKGLKTMEELGDQSKSRLFLIRYDGYTCIGELAFVCGEGEVGGGVSSMKDLRLHK